MYKEYLDRGLISSINKLIKNKEGIIFFIATENYIKYLDSLLASLSINAPNWIYFIIQIGNFAPSENNKKDLIKYYIDFPDDFDTNNKKKAFSANLRIPIINQLVKNINTNKLIYTDIDNLFMKNINDLFYYYPKKKIILKKIKRNFVDQILKTKNLMFYKSGVIVLYTNSFNYLKDDIVVHNFIESYLAYSENNFNEWYTDQISLSKIYQNSDIFNQYTFFSDMVCDWELCPASFIWAAKGYIKETLLWKGISLFISFIDDKLLKPSIIKIDQRIYIAQRIVFLFKLTIYPIIFLRIYLINFVWRILRYSYKQIISFLKVKQQGCFYRKK